LDGTTVVTESFDGVEVSSNTETADAVRAGLGAPAADAPVSAEPPPPAAPTRDASGKFVAAQSTIDAAPAAADAAPSTEPTGDTPPKKARHDVQARIDRAVAAQRAAERELERLRAEHVRPAPTDAEPDESAFESYTDYVKKLSEWQARQTWRTMDRETQQARQQDVFAQRRDARFDAYSAKMALVLAANAGFVESLSETIQNLVPSDALPPGTRATALNAIADEIVDSERPELLQRYLSDHPDEFQRLATLPPRQLTRAMASLETRLSLPTTGSAKPSISQAKPPVKPVESAAPLSDEPPGDDASDSEHYRYYQAQELARRTRRA
jgi:hypothetical protein